MDPSSIPPAVPETTVAPSRAAASETGATVGYEKESAGATMAPRDRAGRALPSLPGYEILHELGRGGMGVVYLARQVGLKRLVALKMILAGGHASPQAIARFRTEAESVARLQHPGIVQIYEIGEHDGLPYFSLEYVEGGPLNGLLAGNPLPPHDAARLTLVLAEAMHFAHQAGVVHRDLKPANVLVTTHERTDDALSTEMAGAQATPSSARVSSASTSPADATLSRGARWQLKITDFGLAKQLDEEDGQTASGDIMGTPSYMAPEQAEGRIHDIGPGTDVYALGAILYEFLTGRPPFKAASRWDTIKLVSHQEPVSPRQLQPGIPSDIETICLKCLRKEPGRRYASAGELAADLGRFLNGEPTVARPVGKLERLYRWCRRRPTQAALVAVSVVSLVALVGLAIWFSALSGAASAQIEFTKNLAATHEFYRGVSEARERRLEAAAGWTWKNQAALGASIKVYPEAVQVPQVTAEAVAAVTAVDLRERLVVAENFTAAILTFSPDGRHLVLGQQRPAGFGVLGGCGVLLVDSQSGETRRRFSFAPDWRFEFQARTPDGVRSLAISPDGRWLVAGSRAGWLHRWDLSQTTPEVTSWQGHAKEICRLMFSRDGESLLSASYDNMVRRWRARDGWPQEAEVTIRERGTLVDLVPLPAVDLVAAITQGSIRLHDAESLILSRPVLDIHSGVSRAVATGRLLILAKQRALELFDAAHLGRVGSLTRPGLQTAEEENIEDLAISPDGGLLASSSDQTQRVTLWDLLNDRMIAEVRVGSGLLKLAFSPDGNTLAVSGKNRTHLYEIAERRTGTVRTLGAHPLLDLKGSRVGDLACLEGWDGDRGGGLVTVWPPGSDRPLHTLRIARRLDSIAISADGTKLATWQGNDSLVVTDLSQRGKEWLDHVKGISGLALGPGSLWTVQSTNLTRWDLQPLRSRARWSNAVGDALSGRGGISALVAGQHATLAGAGDGTLSLLTPEGEISRSLGRRVPEILTCLALSPNEEWAAAGSTSGALVLCRFPGGEAPTTVTLPDGINALAFLGNDLLASGGRDRKIRLWHIHHGQPRELLTIPCPGPITRLASTDQGRDVVALLDRERGLRTWHLPRLLDRLRELGLELKFRDFPPPSRETTVKPTEVQHGPGLVADVFAGVSPEFHLLRRVDPHIDFDWGSQGPDDLLGGNQFSCRWRGWLKAPRAGDYVFSIKADEGVRLWLDGKLLVDAWGNGVSTEVEVRLAEEPHRIRFDFMEDEGPAFCKLKWARGKKADAGPYETIPPSAFFTSREAALASK